MKANGEKKKGQLKKNGKPKEKKNGSVKKENPKEKKSGLMKTGAAINQGGKKNGPAKKNGEGMKTGSMKIGLGKVVSSRLDSLLFSNPSSVSSVRIISSLVRDSSSIVSAYAIK